MSLKIGGCEGGKEMAITESEEEREEEEDHSDELNPHHKP